MNSNVEFSLGPQKETAGESENKQIKWYASAKTHLQEASAVSLHCSPKASQVKNSTHPLPNTAK